MPTLYILVYILFIYLYYTYFIRVYYTSLLYYTLIKNIYDPPHKKISEILPLHSGVIVVLSNK